MPTVTVDYYGVEGTGRNLTEAKRDAGEKIRKALDGYYSPTVLAHRGWAILVYREPAGWCWRIILDAKDGIRAGKVYASANDETESDAIRSASRHLAQLGWEASDGTEPPAFLRDRADRREFEVWAEFQLRFRKAKAAGMSDNDAHHWAGRNPSRPELCAQEL
jgi:hypothetical protein